MGYRKAVLKCIKGCRQEEVNKPYSHIPNKNRDCLRGSQGSLGQTSGMTDKTVIILQKTNKWTKKTQPKTPQQSGDKHGFLNTTHGAVCLRSSLFAYLEACIPVSFCRHLAWQIGNNLFSWALWQRNAHLRILANPLCHGIRINWRREKAGLKGYGMQQ